MGEGAQGGDVKLTIRPITCAQAKKWIYDHHRHSQPQQGQMWSICAMRGDELVGVAVCGRPTNVTMQQRGYLEIIRVCVLEGVEGCCSMLYSRCRRIGQLMGYERFCSYTLPSESGSSLRAAGFDCVAKVRGGSWNRKGRTRTDKHLIQDRLRWESA